MSIETLIGFALFFGALYLFGRNPSEGVENIREGVIGLGAVVVIVLVIIFLVEFSK